MERHFPITDPDAGKAGKCSRTACKNPGDGWKHVHLGGNYCNHCKVRITHENMQWIRQNGNLFVKEGE